MAEIYYIVGAQQLEGYGQECFLAKVRSLWCLAKVKSLWFLAKVRAVWFLADKVIVHSSLLW